MSTPGWGPKIPHAEPNKTMWVSPIASRDSLGCPAVCPPQTGSQLHLGSDKLLSQAEIPETLQSCTLLLSWGDWVQHGGRAVSGTTETEVSTLPRPEAQNPPHPVLLPGPRTQDARMRHPLQLHLFTSWA